MNHMADFLLACLGDGKDVLAAVLRIGPARDVPFPLQGDQRLGNRRLVHLQRSGHIILGNIPMTVNKSANQMFRIGDAHLAYLPVAVALGALYQRIQGGKHLCTPPTVEYATVEIITVEFSIVNIN